jgi:dTDP-4-dehydrorhamnose 3,5-epimerase
MKVVETELSGVFVIEIVPHTDERGMFARTWDPEIARKHGLLEYFDYTCISTNMKNHTLRGMHYQVAPHGEVKLVRCTNGKIFDVVIDLRADSPTFKKWVGMELSMDNHRALYIPEGCAHGFLSLAPGAEVLYHIAGKLVPSAAKGVRFDDPAFSIMWPAVPAVTSERDRAFPDFIA